MERKAFFALALASILAAFAFGVLFSQNAFAQGANGQRQLPIFPRQSEIWSVSVGDLIPADANDWHGNNGGIFTVTRDSLGRLPVLTNIHSGKGTDASYNINLSFADTSTHTISEFWTSSDTFHDSNIGLVIPPGTYFVQWLNNSTVGTRKRVLLSGYWANP